MLDVAAPVVARRRPRGLAASLAIAMLDLAGPRRDALYRCPDARRPRAGRRPAELLAPPGDLLHLGAAAVWLGGLASLLLVFHDRDRARPDGGCAPLLGVRDPHGARARRGRRRARTDRARRGEPALVDELRAGDPRQVRALRAVLVLGWVNRRRLAGGFARLRPGRSSSARPARVVGAVGTLTDLRPGAARATTPEAAHAAAEARQTRLRPRRPGRRRCCAGRARRGRLRLERPGDRHADGRHGNGVADESVTIDGRPGQDCGRGCFTAPVSDRDIAVDVGGTALRFSVPTTLRPATVEVNKLRRDYDALKSIVIDERLSSGPASRVVSRFREEAPAAWPTSSSAATSG